MAPTARDVLGGALLGVGTPLTGWWLAAVAVDRWRQVVSPSPTSPDEVLTLLVATLAVMVAAWLWLGLVLALLGHLPGEAGRWCRRAAERTTPVVVRRCAAVLVGAGLAGALAPGTATAHDRATLGQAAVALSPSFAPTSAADGAARYAAAGTAGSDGTVEASAARAGTPSPATALSPGFTPTTAPSFPEPAASTSPQPGWVPNRPLVRPQPSTRLVSTAPTVDGDRPGTVVRRGDTLWDIVRTHLGPDATDAEIAAQWPRWHQANRHVIGDDPDVLLPGQVLHAPTTEGALR